VCFLDGDSSILVIVCDFDLDSDINLDLLCVDVVSSFFLGDDNLGISPDDELVDLDQKFSLECFLVALPVELPLGVES